MGFLFSGLFWGIILIFLGVTVIINLIFHVHIPLFRIIFALLLIYLGFRVMLGGNWGGHSHCRSAGNAIMFSDATIASDSGDGEYSIIFGKGVVEAGSIFGADTRRRSLRINTVFGSTLVRIPRNIPIAIRASSAFGGITLPDGSTTAFGETIYRNGACRATADESAICTVNVSAVFGACRIEER